MSPFWRRCLLSASLVLAAAAVGWALEESGRRERREAGRELYSGVKPLAGRIVGHDMDLPAQASRCMNCHGDVSRPGYASLAPALTRAALQTPTPRRGGPPSQYDAASFCKLLRNGVDPAHVMIPRTMPRYTITDPDCETLWAYLIAQ